MNTQEAIDLLEELKEAHNYTPPYTEALTLAIEHMKRWQWMPIETAPKDGTEVILCNRVGPTSGFFENERWRIFRHFDLNGCEMLFHLDPEPTHWMPLPEPPHERKD